jgi:DNA primase
MSSSVEKIKERLGIVEVLSTYLKLEKAGGSYKAKCPFHNEKTASFFISPDRGTYYCFGCGVKGDIFTFVQEFEGVEFMQALQILALKAGVEIVPEKRGERNEKEKLFNLLEDATNFFEAGLAKNKEVIAYLEKRGLTSGTIHDWQIGYAENEWRLLYNHLTKKGSDAKSILGVGLVKKNDKASGEPFYDTFRGRIMFPLSDQAGKVVGFSGRIFGAADDGKSPKYLNSPETPLFVKSDFLYGLNKAKMAIRKQDYAIVVEGQFDLILSHQAGFINTVASSGTALTERHIRKIQNLSNRIMFAFDGDSAGFAATERSAHLALSLGMEVKVAGLPAGDDPASLIQKDPKAWSHIISKSKHIIDFYTDSLVSSGIDSRTIGKKVKEKVLPFVLLVTSAIERSHFIKNISEKTGIKEEAIWDDLKNVSKPASLQTSQQQNAASPPSRYSVPRSILGIIFWQEQVKEAHTKVSELSKRLEEHLGKEAVVALKVELEPDKEKLIFEAEQYYDDSAKLDKHIEELFWRLEEGKLKEELDKTHISLKKAEQMKDSALTKALSEHFNQISAKLEELKTKIRK